MWVYIEVYLLDANVLIDANRDYYPITRIPEFWEWLVYVGGRGEVKIPIEVIEEVQEGSDDLASWVKNDDVKAALLLDEAVDVALVTRVTEEGYANDLTDDEIEKIGRDPFLIAHSLRNPDERSVVTTESSKPRSQRANRHIPNVCEDFGVECLNTFEFIRKLNFRTGWRPR